MDAVSVVFDDLDVVVECDRFHISSDGRVGAGNSHDGGFVWVDGNGTAIVSRTDRRGAEHNAWALSPYFLHSRALAVSADGTIVVGWHGQVVGRPTIHCRQL